MSRAVQIPNSNSMREVAPRFYDVITHTGDWRKILDERQQKEEAFAVRYTNEFAHGTTGHNQLILIALMSEILDFLVQSMEIRG